jgi:Uma2 family endonuclease
MTIMTAAAPVTPDELLKLPDAVNYELTDGKLVERHMGMESSRIGTRIVGIFSRFSQLDSLGHLFGADASYKCFGATGNDIKRSDVSFVRRGRFPGEVIPKGLCSIPPDLAVEVISPGDLAYEVEDKIDEYLKAGIPLIWVVYPPQRMVRIRRPRSSPLGIETVLTDTDAITGEDVLPGFSCPVREFFQM